MATRLPSKVEASTVASLGFKPRLSPSTSGMGIPFTSSEPSGSKFGILIPPWV